MATRRSTKNIVNSCKFLRQSDTNIVQVSNRLYNTDYEKISCQNQRKFIFSYGKFKYS